MKKCDNEERLIERAASGDNASFGHLVRHYESFVFNVAYSFMKSYDDAFDVAQDSFIKAWERLSGFQGRSSFSTWLYRITANTAKDALEKRKRQWCDEPIDDIPLSSGDTPEGEIIRREEKERLTSALYALDDDAREILILREFSELSYEEIALELEIEIGTVKSRLNRARAKLREALSDSMEQNREIPVKRDKQR